MKKLVFGILILSIVSCTKERLKAQNNYVNLKLSVILEQLSSQTDEVRILLTPTDSKKMIYWKSQNGITEMHVLNSINVCIESTAVYPLSKYDLIITKCKSKFKHIGKTSDGLGEMFVNIISDKVYTYTVSLDTAYIKTNEFLVKIQ